MQVILIYCRRQKRFSISWLFSCKNWHITFIANLAWKITLITSYITIRSVTTFSNPVYYKCDLQHKFWMTHVIDPSTYAGNKRWKKKTYYKDIEVFKVRAFFFSRTNVTIWEQTCVNDVRTMKKQHTLTHKVFTKSETGEYIKVTHIIFSHRKNLIQYIVITFVRNCLVDKDVTIPFTMYHMWKNIEWVEQNVEISAYFFHVKIRVDTQWNLLGVLQFTSSLTLLFTTHL